MFYELVRESRYEEKNTLDKYMLHIKNVNKKRKEKAKIKKFEEKLLQTFSSFFTSVPFLPENLFFFFIAPSLMILGGIKTVSYSVFTCTEHFSLY